MDPAHQIRRIMPEWFNVVEIVLLVGACYACHLWGIHKGISDTIFLLLEKKIVTQEDLENLNND